MKTKLIVLSGFLCLVIFAQASEKRLLKGNTFTDMGQYEVLKQNEQPGKDVTLYLIRYENSEEEFVVQVCKGDDCKNYVVYGNNVELQYKANKYDVFGLTKTEKQFRKLDKKEAAKRVDREQYYRQKVISKTPKTETEYLGLIACYLPQVVI